MSGDVVDDVVAGLGDVVLTAGELPDSLPEEFLLQFVPLPGGVARGRDVLVAEETRGLQPQDSGDRVGVGVQEFLIADARRAGRSRVEGRHFTIIDRWVSSV